jgi:hypothetical protein
VWLSERPNIAQAQRSPYNKNLQGNELKNALTIFFYEYATDTVVEKLLPFANSQRNESLNSVIGSKKKKPRFYEGSESNNFRAAVACSVAQKNIGFSYINDTLDSIGIDPVTNCLFHNSTMDKKQQKDKIGKSSKNSKVRRHQLQSERISKNAKKEVKKGKTYETGIGLNLVKESSTVCPITSNTTKNHQEITKLVPPFTERLQKKLFF